MNNIENNVFEDNTFEEDTFEDATFEDESTIEWLKNCFDSKLVRLSQDDARMLNLKRDIIASIMILFYKHLRGDISYELLFCSLDIYIYNWKSLVDDAKEMGVIKWIKEN